MRTKALVLDVSVKLIHSPVSVSGKLNRKHHVEGCCLVRCFNYLIMMTFLFHFDFLFHNYLF